MAAIDEQQSLIRTLSELGLSRGVAVAGRIVHVVGVDHGAPALCGRRFRSSIHLLPEHSETHRKSCGRCARSARRRTPVKAFKS